MAVAKGGMGQQNKQSLSELMFSEPMKRSATKLLVSVSVFSVIVSYISWRSNPLLAFPIDKNYMFLVCNGILVLLAKTSLRPAVFDDLNDGDGVHAPPPHAKLLDSLLHKEAAMENRLLLLENEVLEEEEEEKHVIEEREDDEDSRSLMTMMIVGDKGEEESDGFLKESLMEEDCRSFIMQGDDHEEEEEELDEELNNNEVFIEVAEERERLNNLSAEELNKKFEEFIRKMKEDIRIEAQQQHLVLVK
nr:WD repeat-containing protein 87 [Ipomoea batatas]